MEALGNAGETRDGWTPSRKLVTIEWCGPTPATTDLAESQCVIGAGEREGQGREHLLSARRRPRKAKLGGGSRAEADFEWRLERGQGGTLAGEDEQLLFTVEGGKDGEGAASFESLPRVVVRSVASGGKALSVDPTGSARGRKHKLVFRGGQRGTGDICEPSTSELCQWFVVEDADSDHVLLL